MRRPLAIALLLLAPACRRHAYVAPKAAVAAQTLAAAKNRTCVLRDGHVACVGQIGLRVSFVPVPIPDTEGALALDDAGAFGCVVRADRTVACFGTNASGELGTPGAPRSDRAVAVPGVSNAVQLALGRTHACARLGDGHVSCWGAGRAPARISGVDSVAELAADLDTTCARRRDGSVWCWGGSFGATPTRLTTRARSVTLGAEGGCVVWTDGAAGCFTAANHAVTPLAGIAHARAIALTDRGRCVLDDAGVATCTDGPRVPDVVELASSPDHVCAKTKQGDVLCWGDDTFGQLGDRAPSEENVAPRRVTTGKALSMGGSTACTVGDVVTCWTAGSPQPIPALAGTRVLARGRDHACAVDRRGALRCFGLARTGQLGVMSDAWSVAEPTLVPGLPEVVDVAVGDAATCARAVDGRVFCFGANSSGQFAVGTSSMIVATPTVVPALAHARRVVLGNHHLCALFVDGSVSCAGSNGMGELGRAGGSSPLLVKVALDHVVDLAAADRHGCARLDTGEVRCWGMRFRNSVGPLEGKDVDWFDTPQPVAERVVSLAVGRAHACIVREGGDVLCWGANEDGSCGTPLDGDVASPRVVEGVRDAVEVQVGEHGSCARTSNDEVWCWGRDRVDGPPERVVRSTPVRMRP